MDALKKHPVAWLAVYPLGAVLACVGVAKCSKCPQLLTPSSGLNVFKRVCRKRFEHACVKLPAGIRVMYVDASVPSRGLTFVSIVAGRTCAVVVM